MADTAPPPSTQRDPTLTLPGHIRLGSEITGWEARTTTPSIRKSATGSGTSTPVSAITPVPTASF